MQRRTLDAMTQRLAAQTWAWLDGDTGQVLLWLQRLGCRIITRPELGQTWVLRGISGGKAALTRGADPIAIASAIGFLCGGMRWPQAFPELLRIINKEWAHRMRTNRKRLQRANTKEHSMPERLTTEHTWRVRVTYTNNPAGPRQGTELLEQDTPPQRGDIFPGVWGRATIQSKRPTQIPPGLTHAEALRWGHVVRT